MLQTHRGPWPLPSAWGASIATREATWHHQPVLLQPGQMERQLGAGGGRQASRAYGWRASPFPSNSPASSELEPSHHHCPNGASPTAGLRHTDPHSLENSKEDEASRHPNLHNRPKTQELAPQARRQMRQSLSLVSECGESSLITAEGNLETQQVSLREND